MVKSDLPGKDIETDILEAAIQELASVGYTNLRIEHIAERANVNTSSIYRRWTGVPDLVMAAILALPGAELDPPDTGSPYGDLMELGRRIARFASTNEGLAVMRLFALPADNLELFVILYELRKSYDGLIASIFGHYGLDEATKKDISQLLPAILYGRLVIAKEPVDEAYLSKITKTILLGAEHCEQALYFKWK